MVDRQNEELYKFTDRLSDVIRKRIFNLVYNQKTKNTLFNEA